MRTHSFLTARPRHARGRAGRPLFYGILVVLLAAVLFACIGSVGGRTEWAQPQPDRPTVRLAFDVADDLRTVEGRSGVIFTPDLPTCELMFRAWPNKPTTARTGSQLLITEARVDDTAVSARTSAGGAPAGSPGTLIELPVPGCAEAGQRISADLVFQLTLGENADERMGFSHDRDLAWFATAFPLLDWERGRGPAGDPAVDIAGEMSSTETFRLASLEVSAPTRYQVAGTGRELGASPATDDTTVHRFSAAAVRDVTVTVGRLKVLRRDLDGVRLYLVAPHGETSSSLMAWARRIDAASAALVEFLGPFPYDELWVTIQPYESAGIELSGAILFGDLDLDRDGWLVGHELAHMWFYGLVGNNQARDPWLDESFASFAQAVADGREDDYAPVGAAASGRPAVGAPMTTWAELGQAAYEDAVYEQGAAALLEGRRQVGAQRFDEALRGYLHTQAHRIATPADVERAFDDLSEVLAPLREVGALTT